MARYRLASKLAGTSALAVVSVFHLMERSERLCATAVLLTFIAMQSRLALRPLWVLAFVGAASDVQIGWCHDFVRYLSIRPLYVPFLPQNCILKCVLVNRAPIISVSERNELFEFPLKAHS